MARPKHSRSKRLVLDIGSSAIRLCELAQTKTGFQLTKYYQREFLAEPSMSEEEKKTLQCGVLAQLLKDAKVRTRKTIFGVPGQSVFVRNRALPPVPEHKVTQIVRYEIQQQIPFGLDQIALDYQVLKQTEVGGYDVLMAAIKVEVVDKRIDIIRTAKCRVDVVDVCPMAAYNWIKNTGEFGAQGECVALLDLGASTTDIVIEREGQFRFTRSLNLGGNDVTTAISNGFSMTYAEAEKLKRERGFAPTGDAKADGRGGEVIGQVLNRLVTEINRSFAYFRSQPGGGAVSRVIVTGGGACLRNIVPFLQRQLGVEVRIAQPLSGLAIAPAAQEASEHPEQACVALGLALRCVASVPIDINLIPPRILISARRKEQAFYWALSLVTLMLILATIIPDNAQKNEQKEKQIEKVTRTLQLYDPELVSKDTSRSKKEFEAKKSEIEGYRNAISALDSARNGRVKLLDLLKAINDARPEGRGLWFSDVETLVIGAAAIPGGAIPQGGPAPGEYDGSPTPYSSGSGSGVPSTGFPGLAPASVTALAGTAASGDDPAATGAPGMGFGGMSQTQDSLPPPIPNGIRIRGYAQDPETVNSFVVRLKEGTQFKVEDPADKTKQTDGVYFDESSVNRYPASILDNATDGFSGFSAAGFSSGSLGMGGGRGRRDADEESGSPFGGQGMRAGGGGGGGSSAIASPNEPNVVSFLIELQFSGTKVDVKAPAALGPGLIPQGLKGGIFSGRKGGADRRKQ
ncbi:MAG: type IV pilus assembly protein PilM [Candidatus Hydrogenedentes bacterium]|nr:type IV pilus assembly protein PilM [Candidatus Hydrogenedentota bacterium]